MRRLIIAAAFLLVPATVWAQSNAELQDKISRLERDVSFLQKQVYAVPQGDPNSTTPPSAGTAQLGVKLASIEEELRTLRGQVETAQFNAGENKRDLQKLREDMEYRLSAIEQAQSAAAIAAQAGAQAQAAATTPAAAPAATTATPAKPEAAASVSEAPAAYQPGKKPAATGADFPDSNAAYNAAFKQLNTKNYSAAATQFDAFVKKYPQDPLVSNAYYWLGESYYARGDYPRAAEGFRKGFESNPQGQKAPDNLLKLAMSLDNIKRTSEACIVLGQVVSKYSDSAPRTKERAETERTRMQCK